MTASTIMNVKVGIVKTQRVKYLSRFIREMDQDVLGSRSTKNVRRISIVGLSSFVTQPQACAKSRSKWERTVREKTSVSTTLLAPLVNAQSMAESSTGNHPIMLWHVLVVLSSRFVKTRGTHFQLIGVIITLCFRIAPTSAKVMMMSACIRQLVPLRWISTSLVSVVYHQTARASAQQLIKNPTQRI